MDTMDTSSKTENTRERTTMFSKLGFRIATIATFAIFAIAAGSIFFLGGGKVSQPLMVTNVQIHSANPFERGCTMTLQDWSGNKTKFEAYPSECLDLYGESVYIMGDRVYEY